MIAAQTKIHFRILLVSVILQGNDNRNGLTRAISIIDYGLFESSFWASTRELRWTSPSDGRFRYVCLKI